MADLRAFTGYLTLDVLGSATLSLNDTFTLPAAGDPLDILIQDDDATLDGDTVVQEQSGDAGANQIGFVTNANGDVLLDGAEVYLEQSFTFTVDGGAAQTGYVIESQGGVQSFVVLPQGVDAGLITVTGVDETATGVAYSADLGSGGETIDANDFSDLDLTAADNVVGGAGGDTIDAGAGDDSVVGGDGADSIVGNAGDDTVLGGAGDDVIRGDSGDVAVSAVRESFNWAQLGLTNGQTVPNTAGGIDQDTGNITVNFSYDPVTVAEGGRFDDLEYRNTATQNTDGIDTGGETIGNDVGFLLGNGTSPAGDTVVAEFNFSANAAGFEDEVQNVQFRINDVDDATWRDILTIRAFDAAGAAVHVNLVAGSNITLTDTDGVNGFDTAIANNTNSNNQPADASNSLLVEVGGPVSRIEITYGNLETAVQRVDITDVFFDAVPTPVANTATGDDSLLGEAGSDTIFGEGGADTIDGGIDADSIDGGANDDLLVINDGFGNDTIIGGEAGETTGDTLDGGALTQAVNVDYTGDEAAGFTNAVTGDVGSFSEIEHINTGSGDDTIDGSLDTVGIDLNAGAGADTILGGQGADTLNAGSGADTIDGQAGADTILAGDGPDEIRLTAGYGDDSIVGGEGGTDSDTVTGATLTENVVVNYTGSEQGAFVGQTSGDSASFQQIEAVTTGSGADTVNASADASGQIITTNAGNDSVIGGSGGDTIDAGANNDTVDGGGGADSITGGSGNDSLLGGAGADTIDAGTGGDTIDGGDGADSINASNGFDLINLSGNFGNDTIVGGEAGNDGDTLSGATLSEDVIVTATGVESGAFVGQTTGSSAGFTEIETIETGSGDDTVIATADTGGVDVATNAGADSVLGGSGADTVSTGAGADTINGAGGADSITAGDGDDLVQLTNGFGADTIIGGEGGETTGDTLDGATITDSVTVTFNGIEQGDFAAGGDTAAFSEIEVVNTGTNNDFVFGGADTDGVTVNTNEGDDIVFGGIGDDLVTLGDGDDTLSVSDAFGNDTVTGGEGTEVVGDILTAAAVTTDITLNFAANEAGTLSSAGQTLEFSEIERFVTGSGADTVNASATNSGVQITTGAGDDTVLGGQGADSITAGDGDDDLRIENLFGDDTIIGGEGGETTGDTLSGGGLTENVTVTFNPDDESGTVANAGGDVASFAEIEAVVTGSGDDVINAAGSTGGVNVDSGAGADTITGGAGDDTFAAGAGADTISAGAGADSITAGDGDDTIALTDGYGNDTIVGGEGGETNGDLIDGSTLTEAVNVLFSGDEQGDITGDVTGDVAGFSEIEAITTGAGDDTVNAAQDTQGVTINTGIGADTVLGGQGGDTLSTGAGQDTVNGGAGADNIDAGDDQDTIQLTDGFGDDTITGGGGGVDQDTLDGGALTENVTVTYAADESGAIANVAGDNATFADIEALTTGSGDDSVDASATTGGVTVATGEGADTLAGGQGADSLDGQGGDDVFQVADGFGDDTITGGETNETNGDSIDGSALTQDTTVTFNADGESGGYANAAGDNLQFAEIEAVSTGAGADTIDATNATVGVNADAGGGDDTVTGGVGADTLAGGAGADTITGGEGADSIDGGADDDAIFGGIGDDTLTGGAGNDVFTYNPGDGNDVITDFNVGNTGPLNDGDQTNNDFIDLTQFYSNLNEARADLDDDGILNQSVGDFTDNTLFDGGSLTLNGVTPGGLTQDNTNLGLLSEFPHVVQGADGGAGVNQNGDNIFDDGRFYVEFIDNTGPTSQLSDLGFDTIDGSLGAATVYSGGTTDTIDIENQLGTLANDGTEYGARLTSTLDITQGGVYTFSTTSDDGSILYIDGNPVVLNDGLHSSRTETGTINLDPGQHEVTILFFENGGVENLSATIQGPDYPTATALDDPSVNLQANFGNETVSGGAGDDTFQAGAGDDNLFGQDGQDVFQLVDGFDSDTIVGGEGGIDVDTLDQSALTAPVNVVYNGAEAGTTSDATDTALFSEIETQILTAGADTLNAAQDTSGVNVFAGAGGDTLLGGTGGDTIRGEAGDDTIDGGAGADSLDGGNDQDVFALTDGFGADTIVGGEGGTDNDTLDHSALSNPVNVLYTGNEQGTTTDGVDTANFSEIENQILTGFDDTLDATLDNLGVNVDGGDGADALTGGGAADTLIGGIGDDTINGGAGLDSIDGGADNDVLDGGDNTDTIFGGAGNDSITDTGGALSDDTIFGGAGDDTIDGGAREDAIDAGDGDDLINLTGVFGDDTIIGGEAGETNGDTVSGSTLTEDAVVTFSGDEAGDFVSQAGNGSAGFTEIEAVETGLGADTVDATQDTTGVTIITNAGDDVIIGGAGDDSIDAGADNDTITFGQNDTVLGGAGADEFIIQPTAGGMTVIGDFDPSTNVDNTTIFDSANPPDQTDNDFVDLSSFFASINELRAANTPNGDGDVVLDLGGGQTLTFVGVSDVSLLNFENTNVVCFTRGALIRTPNGDIAVEDLVEGDLVNTMDNGAQPIRWIGRRVISAHMLNAAPRLRPVRIAAGALGNTRDLLVSPQHRMLLGGDRAEMLFGADQVLASAKDLIDGDGIHMGPAEDVEYFHILFDAHEIIFAEDAPTESFHPGEQALSTTTARMQAEILELFPELAADCDNRPMARMALKSHEARALVG